MNQSKSQIFGYLRVSTADQNINSQKECIRDYCEQKKWVVDHWIIAEYVSTRKSLLTRKITDLITRLQVGDICLVSELTRLGRSNREVLQIVEEIYQKGAEIHLIKNNLIINGQYKDSPFNNLILSIFAMFGQFERDIISSRTKDGLARARLAGKQIGSKKGVLKKSMFDSQREQILYLLHQGYSYRNISKLIQLGSDRSLFAYVKSRQLVSKARKLNPNYTFALKKVPLKAH